VKPYIILVIVAAVLIYVVAEILSGSSVDHQPASSTQRPNYNEAPGRTRDAVPTEIRLPADEQAFIEAVQQGQTAFQSSPNELAAGRIRFQRGVSICRILAKRSISDWTGRVTTLESNSDGKGVLAITLADNISVTTWNNDLSDSSYGTLIEPSSTLSAAVSTMRMGDQVSFTGTFFPGGNDVDCVKEASMSLHGSMQEPEFVFRFMSVREEN
jgi:hypothetical protein